MNSESGDALVASVASRLGTLSPDEQAAVYGAGYAYDTGGDRPLPPQSVEWIAAVLQDFRAAPCQYCDHRLLEHSLSVSESGPAVTCDAGGTTRSAWDWHAGPRPASPWLILLAVVLWVAIPLVTIGLASWLMPLISAVMYKKRPWALAALAWGALTVLLVVFIENQRLATALGFLALLIWFGSAIYGGFQIKRWLECVKNGRS